ncbi:MAG: hypothetical protein M1361_01285 [Patescibacteria group bacterium]|nr:hypothetical protein [Patescibacteria group bacterium]MCL5224234.1 hypothetical protein [Patescibacteria group bacterium]
MVNLILELALMLGLGAVVYLIAVAAPRVQDDQHFGEHPIKNWARHLPLERIDGFIARITDKTLRRLKVWILKADNSVSKHISERKDETMKPL